MIVFGFAHHFYLLLQTLVVCLGQQRQYEDFLQWAQFGESRRVEVEQETLA